MAINKYFMNSNRTSLGHGLNVTAFFYKISNQSFLYEIEKQHLLFIFSEIQKFKNQVNWTKVDNRGLHN